MDTDHGARDGKHGEARDKKAGPRDKRGEGKEKKEWRFRWAVQVFFISVALSGVLSFCSSEALEGAELGLAFGVLAFFILLGIVFDIIGVAVTAADERPFHSMAARKTPGARQALSRSAGPTRSPASATTWWAISAASSAAAPRR